MNELEEFGSTILARQTEAEAALVQGDPEPPIELTISVTGSRLDQLLVGHRSGRGQRRSRLHRRL